jgi:hypothetical protein
MRRLDHLGNYRARLHIECMETEKQNAVKQAAARALAEAQARRTEREATQKTRPKESGGQSGPEPTRYGDWEKDGIVSDF